MLVGLMVAGREKLFGGLVVIELLPLPQPGPQFGGGRERVDHSFDAGEEVKLDDFLAVGGIGELQVQDFGIFLGLLKPLARRLVAGLGLHDGDGEITGVAEPVVSPLLFATSNPLGSWNDPPIGEGVLLVDLVVRPARPIELRQNVHAAGVGFGFGHGGSEPFFPEKAQAYSIPHGEEPRFYFSVGVAAIPPADRGQHRETTQILPPQVGNEAANSLSEAASNPRPTYQ